jgi:hypothetical protein
MKRRLPIPRYHLIALVGYVLLTIIFTFPLILRLDTHVLGGPKYDNYEYVWKMWWVPHALFERGISPFFHPDVYVPFGYPLAYGEITPIHTFGMIPLTLLFGEIAAYNVAALASFVLTGWATYVLARHFLAQIANTSDDRLLSLASFFAGAAFAFCAYRMQKLGGHMPLFDTHWLVLSILALDIWLEQKKPIHALFTGLFVSFAALSSWYYAFMLALLLPVYVLFRVSSIRSLLVDRRTWSGLAVIGLIAAVLCLPFLIPYLQLDSEGATVVPMDDAAFWAASPTDYLMPNPMHPLWGAAVRSVVWPFPTPMMTEFVISIGWITLILSLPAWRQAQGRQWRALKAMIITAFVLSLGPILYISRLPLGIPLPVMLLRELLPFADSIRSWGRFSVFVMLGMSLLAAAGIMIGFGSLRARVRYSLALGALALMLFGTWIGPFPQIRIEPRPVDTWLAQQPNDSPIMEYPLSEALSGPAMLSTRYHHKPVVFGYGTYLPLIYRQRHPDLLTFPDDPALDQLAEWGVRYILITIPTVRDERTFTMAQVDAQPRLRHVVTLADVAVYELQPEVAPNP